MKITWKRVIALVLTVLMVASLAACSDGTGDNNANNDNKPNTDNNTPNTDNNKPADGDEEPEDGDPAEDEKYGGKVTFACTLSKNDVGYPCGAAGETRFYSQPAIEPLGRYTEGGEVEGWLAEEINVDKENLKIVLKLREGVKYHDGTDFNAQAVCDVWQIYLDDGKINALLETVEKFEATGEYEVTVTLNSWSVAIVSNLCCEAGYMFSPTAYKEYGTEGINTHIIGTGPFVMDSYDVSLGIIYKANENYWGGRPYLDEIEMIFTDNVTTQENIFKSGDANVFWGLNIETYNRLVNEGVETVCDPSCLSPTVTGIFFNTTNKEDPISDVRVRQAICHAIDRDALNAAFNYGRGTVHTQLAVPGTKEYNEDVKGYEYDVEKAKALLKEAGYEEGECTITVFYNAGNLEDMFVAISGMLTKAGFNVVADTRVSTESRNRYGTTDPYDSVCFWYAPTTIDNWYRYFSANPSTGIISKDDIESYGLIECYEACMGSVTDEEFHDNMMELQRLATEELCLYLPFFSVPVAMHAFDGTVMDHGIGEYWHCQWTPESMYITK